MPLCLSLSPADLKTLHESDLTKLSDANIKYKVGIDEIVEECDQKIGVERAKHAEAIKLGRYTGRFGFINCVNCEVA